ncbi:tetratricopeptide repeat protein [Roseimaritima ulvae]|uniref:Lipoprotein NlpI n=1 Tax=Roseimaritima ulvae TaxID=980254 RepID=A0A5B9QKI7_9BACT|nr:tetratricopeptide repeat-containing glycosyltransferase family protein [Roseimaritima ulvae]QEG38055.1 lipoprotein NlpI [Roseimaritima ulvae]
MPTIRDALQQGWQLQQRGQIAQAEHVYRQVIAQVPRSAEAHVYLGIALFDQQRFVESEAAYRTGLELQGRFPIAWNNLGNALRMQNRVDEADACFARSIEQQPGYLSPLKNRGTLWIWAGHIDRGLDYYQQALQVAPEDPELHRNLGVIYLLQGRFAEGWPQYRWRWNMPGLVRPPCSAPLWQGEPLQDKTILLYPEQGLGDAIHFVRMAEVVQQHGARVLLSCDANLIPLLQSARGIDQIFPTQMTVGPVDYQASLIEVADHLQIDGQNIPAAVPYLTVSDSLQSYWQRWLSSQVGGSGRRVGICWQGNPNHHADHYRSVALREFAPLFDVEGVQWISLQHGFGSQQIAEVPFADKLLRLPEDLDRSAGAFLDTAAVMQNLDLVITTDTSTAHLAGALGVPTWVLLGKLPDWRWSLEGSTTHWYPSLRLFRQQVVGNWQGVVREMAGALAEG